MSSEYIVYQGEQADEAAKWLLLSKNGSTFERATTIELENFVRGSNPEDRKKGELLWACALGDKPEFKQLLHREGALSDQIRDQLHPSLCTVQVGGLSNSPLPPWADWGTDGTYTNIGTIGSGTNFNIRWSMSASVLLTSGTRMGPRIGSVQGSSALSLQVFAAGTAVCVYQLKARGPDKEEGRQRWEQNVTEIVNTVQFQLIDESGSVVKVAGMPAAWAVPGDSKFGTPQPESLNWDCPLFTVAQGGGVGLFDSQPPVFSTKAGVDPTLAIAVAHLATHEFSVSGVKKAFRPNFPRNPTSNLGLLNDKPADWEDVSRKS